MIEVDLADYQRGGSRRRPGSLDSPIFYHEISIPHTPELEQTADTAVEVLLQDEFTYEEAVELVGLHIQAAASFAHSAHSQAELITRVADVPNGAGLQDSRDQTRTIAPYEALAIAGFLPHVAPYEFNTEEWLLDVIQVPEGWELTQSTLRWMDTWQDTVSVQARAEILLRTTQISFEAGGAQDIALYSSKLSHALSDDPETLRQLLAFVEPDARLPLFGELGLDAPESLEIWDEIPDKEIHRSNAIRQVRHVNYFAGDCPVMDRGHRKTLLEESTSEPSAHGNVALVSVQGQLVGSIKLTDNHSMLALRTVQDDAGNLPLVIGGVYIPGREVVEQAEAAAAQQGKWARIELDTLEVRPLRFLDVETPEAIGQLRAAVAAVKAARDALEASQLIPTE
ncbi:MAG TPA: hypothetical protein VK694_07905 [Verrucomicrobiae bacterium]|nr:hypothetical protein [Verrucomicrobiae bacterium]